MKFNLIFKEPFYRTINESYWWYEEQLPGLGDRLMDEVNICLEKLRNTPHHYSIDRENFRQILLKHFPFKLVYEIMDKEVVVYTLFHTKRNPESLFE